MRACRVSVSTYPQLPVCKQLCRQQMFFLPVSRLSLSSVHMASQRGLSLGTRKPGQYRQSIFIFQKLWWDIEVEVSKVSQELKIDRMRQQRERKGSLQSRNWSNLLVQAWATSLIPLLEAATFLTRPEAASHAGTVKTDPKSFGDYECSHTKIRLYTRQDISSRWVRHCSVGVVSYRQRLCIAVQTSVYCYVIVKRVMLFSSGCSATNKNQCRSIVKGSDQLPKSQTIYQGFHSLSLWKQKCFSC